MFKKILRGALYCLVGSAVISLMGWALLTGLNKEADRMDSVRDSNCALYGAAINKHAGSEVCSPTPQG